MAIPLENVSAGNLTKLLDAKGELIKKALGVDDIRIEIDEEKFHFLGFPNCRMQKPAKLTRISLQHSAR